MKEQFKLYKLSKLLLAVGADKEALLVRKLSSDRDAIRKSLEESGLEVGEDGSIRMSVPTDIALRELGKSSEDPSMERLLKEEDDRLEINLDFVSDVLKKAKIEGFGGACAEAAEAINEVLFFGQGEIVGIFNKWAWDTFDAPMGHVVVGWRDKYFDAEGERTYEEVASFGQIDEESGCTDAIDLLGNKKEKEDATKLSDKELHRKYSYQWDISPYEVIEISYLDNPGAFAPFDRCNLEESKRVLEESEKAIEREWRLSGKNI